MAWSVRFHRLAAVLVAGVCLGLAGPPARAQVDADQLVSTQAGTLWNHWDTAMKAVVLRDAAAAEAAFAQLLEQDPSPLRLALFADYTVQKTREGGGVLRLEEDLAAGKLEGPAKDVAERLAAGREQMHQADDGFYFASIGQFPIANANFEALLNSNPDPQALIEFIDRVPRRRTVLVTLADHPLLGAAIQRMAGVLAEGEKAIEGDPTRIKQNIARLGGPPRAYENGAALLRESGEYAIPFLVQTLQDSAQSALLLPIQRVLPEVGKPAINPLVMALRTRDQAVRLHVVEALGKIGYVQAAPYLLAVRNDPATAPNVRDAALNAVGRLAQGGINVNAATPLADAFYLLAQAYYDNASSLAADPRLAKANVWYWRDELLLNVQVPTPIFNEIMAMRCAEEALRVDPNHKEAIALWVAANIRREAELPDGASDDTRPETFPSAEYFAQSAGAEYSLMALARAVEDQDAIVALGAIAALQRTAGTASLLGGNNRSSPLAAALTFPERMVRVRAALALASARPDQAFAGSDALLPVLAEAVQLHAGKLRALVIDSEEDAATALAADLRGLDYEVITDAGLLGGLSKARQLASVDAIFVSSQLDLPITEAIQQIRGEFRFASTPLFIVRKPGDADMVEALIRLDPLIGEAAAGMGAEALQAAVQSSIKSAGATLITPDIGRALSLEAAAAIGVVAESGGDAFDPKRIASTLLEALGSADAGIQVAAGDALAFVATREAQEAIAKLALAAEADAALRMAMFSALAESGKRNGNMLSEATVALLIAAAESEADLTIRTAASQSLGALSLPGNPASQIIRNVYGG